MITSPTFNSNLKLYNKSKPMAEAKADYVQKQQLIGEQIRTSQEITDLLSQKQSLLQDLSAQLSQIEGTHLLIQSLQKGDQPLLYAQREYVKQTLEEQTEVITRHMENQEKSKLAELKESQNCPKMYESLGAADELLEVHNVQNSELQTAQLELQLAASQNHNGNIQFQAALVNNLKSAKALTATNLSTRSSLRGSKVFISPDQLILENQELEAEIKSLKEKKEIQDKKNAELKLEIEKQEENLKEAKKYCKQMQDAISEFKKSEKQ